MRGRGSRPCRADVRNRIASSPVAADRSSRRLGSRRCRRLGPRPLRTGRLAAAAAGRADPGHRRPPRPRPNLTGSPADVLRRRRPWPRLAAHPSPRCAAPSTPPPICRSWVRADPWLPHVHPLVLVCTNGRHDPCCATFGRPLARVLREGAQRDDVWECSHIGGDRFAANIVILPEGPVLRAL